MTMMAMATSSAPPHGDTTTTTSLLARRSVLDSVMAIEKDCAEKREIAAMSNYHAASQAKMGAGGGGGKLLSWTALATMAMAGDQRNGMNAGMVALEMARKGCRNCDRHRAARSPGWQGMWLWRGSRRGRRM
jgi:hypothetical protein